MFSRRDFFRLGAGGASLYLVRRLGGIDQVVHAAPIPGGTLDPGEVDKFVTPLLVPPVMPRAGKIAVPGGPSIDYYEIAVRQFMQQILPPTHPATKVWGYGPAAAQGGPVVFHAPSLTIEAVHGAPVRIKWINDLVDGAGNYLPHLLPVDPTLHWANPPGGDAGRDSHPQLDETPGPYTGPVPFVTHVHGAVGVGDESDGYSEAWVLPAAADIPDGYATEGTWYDFFAQKASNAFGATWGPGFVVFQYPNDGRASTEWYHDHTLGMTRLNVYAGPAGFYLVRGGPGDVVRDARTGGPAKLPGPAPFEGNAPGKVYGEIPLAIQDRSFHADGTLFYPDSRTFFDDVTGPFLPDGEIPPIWNPEFFGNMIIVNGNTWPSLTVQQRRYRFRVLNGCQSRFLILDFNGIPNVDVWVIGNEGGFLSAPVHLTADHGNRLVMGPAERMDLIVDFNDVPAGQHVLGNVGPDSPFGGGEPDVDFEPADATSTGLIMAFEVVPTTGVDPTTPPEHILLPPVPQVGDPVRTRKLALLEEMAESSDGEMVPVAALLGTVTSDVAVRKLWPDPVTENPEVGDTEVWELYNFTADAHPIHVHEVTFEVVDRQDMVFDPGPPVRILELIGTPRSPEPWETSPKDTVIAYPGQVTRIRAQFTNPGQFVWHCHIVEHEDNEMMRPYRIGPPQPGQPE